MIGTHTLVQILLYFYAKKLKAKVLSLILCKFKSFLANEQKIIGYYPWTIT